MSTGYFFVGYQTADSTSSITNYATVSSINPWNNTSSTTAILPTTTTTTTTGTTTTTTGTWQYFVVDNFTDLLFITGIYSKYNPDSSDNTTTYIPSVAEVNSNSVLYVYISGTSGTGVTGGGGGGTGGFAAACLNITYPVVACLNIKNNQNLSGFIGVDYTLDTDMEVSSTYLLAQLRSGESSNYTISVYSGSGCDTTSADGGDGSNILAIGTDVLDIESRGVEISSYILYLSTLDSVQSVSPNIAFCIGGVGGQPATGGTAGSSYNTLPTGYPNWIGSTGSTGTSGSTNEFNITMADGTLYPMPSSIAGTNAATSSILFAIFTPTATSS